MKMIKSTGTGDKKFFAAFAALTVAFALCMKLITMAVSSAPGVPSLFVNDSIFRYHEDYPLEIINGDEYVPVIFFEFLSTSDIEVKYVDNGFYILYKKTNRYIAFETDTDYGSCGTLSMYFYCPTYMLNKVRYVPLAVVADYLGILYETNRQYGAARIKDRSARKSFDQLIAKYTETPTTAATLPPPTNPPYVTSPPSPPPTPPPPSDVPVNTVTPTAPPEVVEPTITAVPTTKNVPITTQTILKPPAIITNPPTASTTLPPATEPPIETTTIPPETTTSENTDSISNYFIFRGKKDQNYIAAQDNLDKLNEHTSDVDGIVTIVTDEAGFEESIETEIETGDEVEANDNADIADISEDNNSRSENIDSIIGLLKKEDIKSVFFFTGSEILDNPLALRKIYAAGHEVGIIIEDGKMNPSTENLTAELEEVNALIYAITKHKTRFYLFDENLYDDNELKKSCIRILEGEGYYAIKSNLDISAHQDIFNSETANMESVIDLIKQNKVNIINFDIADIAGMNDEYTGLELIVKASEIKFYINVSQINNANIEHFKN